MNQSKKPKKPRQLSPLAKLAAEQNWQKRCLRGALSAIKSAHYFHTNLKIRYNLSYRSVPTANLSLAIEFLNNFLKEDFDQMTKLERDILRKKLNQIKERSK